MKMMLVMSLDPTGKDECRNLGLVRCRLSVPSRADLQEKPQMWRVNATTWQNLYPVGLAIGSIELHRGSSSIFSLHEQK